MKFSFVIPSYNNYTLLHTLLWDIYKNCSPIYEVFISDDGDDQATLDGLTFWKDLLPIKHDRHKDLGFLKNSNYGLKNASGEILCLVSTDVHIHRDIAGFSQSLNSNEMLGGRYLDFDTGWNQFNGKIFPYLEGWLLCGLASFWKELDYFDEQFVPNDMEDVDFSTKVIQASGVLRVYPEGHVTHIGAQTIQYGDEREKITLENKKKFYEKWVA